MDAEWFSDSVLADEDVVGITLPKLPGIRKQSFGLVERSAQKPKRGAKLDPPPLARRASAAAVLGRILDEYGATRAAAFGRSRLIFEPTPTLFFAELALSRVKPRAANKLRRLLIDNGFRACVLRIEQARTIIMFWPAAETGITSFVEAASPSQKMHTQFDQAEDARAKSLQTPTARQELRKTSKDQALGTSERKRLQSENTALLEQISDLRAEVARLQKSQSALGAMEQLGLDDARLKSMLRLLHPDKHGGSEAANEAAKWINGLRDLLKARPAD
jgi:hypothetical protein